MSRSDAVSRRTVLRGAGVALALPWLASLAPRRARGQSAQPRRTFIAMSFPEGVTPLFWRPPATGVDDAWTLSPILAPLAPVKQYVNVLANVGNYGPFGGHVEPSESNLTAALLTCVRPVVSNNILSVGTSVDQLIAQGGTAPAKLDSLQVGLSTLNSYEAGLPGACSRSISWRSPIDPTFKLIDPQAVFDKVVGAGNLPAGNDPLALERRARNKSVLDQVLSHAKSVRAQAGQTDRARMDAFMDSVRALETKIQANPLPSACVLGTRPTQQIAVGQVPADYNRNTHADLMIDLVVMAIACDVTRVVSFMLDDSRSDFVYDFLPMRHFTTTGSTLSKGNVQGLDGLTHSGNNNDGYATIRLWFVEKLSRLCQKLMASPSGEGNLLDDATIWFGSEMHGANFDARDLPIVTVGKGGGRLATNRFVDFAETPRQTERLANLHLTFLRSVFDLPIKTFGTAPPATSQPDGGEPANSFGPGTAVIPEILA
jgi:hypothetical protein